MDTDAALLGGAIAIVAAAVASVAYLSLCLVVLLVHRRGSRKTTAPCPGGVSVLKPLCGAEPDLADNIRSFCREAGTDVEILFGARDPDDPALAVARQVCAEFPDLDARFVSG